MAAPRSGNTVIFSTSISKETNKLLTEAALKFNMTKSKIVELALKAWVEKQLTGQAELPLPLPVSKVEVKTPALMNEMK